MTDLIETIEVMSPLTTNGIRGIANAGGRMNGRTSSQIALREPLFIDIRGYSMAPEFRHGDQVLIDTSQTCTAQPGLFAVNIGGEYVLRLIERIPGPDNKIRMFFANERYSDCVISANEVQVLGRASWRGRRL